MCVICKMEDVYSFELLLKCVMYANLGDGVVWQVVT